MSVIYTTYGDDGASYRMTLVVPRHIPLGERENVQNKCWLFISQLGYCPRILVGKRVRVLTGVQVYRDI